MGQIPGGALVDAIRRKMLLIAVGTLMIAGSAVLPALSRDFPAVVAAEVLHGATGAIIGPAIAAISLGLAIAAAISGLVIGASLAGAASKALEPTSSRAAGEALIAYELDRLFRAERHPSATDLNLAAPSRPHPACRDRPGRHFGWGPGISCTLGCGRHWRRST